MSQLEHADDLAVRVFWFLGDHWLGHHAPTDEEKAELRAAALRFAKEPHNIDPVVSKARDMADAVLELLSPCRRPGSVAKLKHASNAYQDARFR
ncbi:hypothetical protein [Mycobacterium montefiorense]|uniref:hypothetical protein n=1 Tax=Mycobacterium montefiorense TaxID=154654 RepID=UPI0021DE6EA2|nr:hypothetical protein [Mycobacterium montefiorense]MCV7427626.1 hypothetical protein [Mycobacterium montefiorense]GLE52103.1 hypothetical protein ATCCBAA256_16770 [Mycobacterium montefiorense]